MVRQIRLGQMLVRANAGQKIASQARCQLRQMPVGTDDSQDVGTDAS